VGPACPVHHASPSATRGAAVRSNKVGRARRSLQGEDGFTSNLLKTFINIRITRYRRLRRHPPRAGAHSTLHGVVFAILCPGHAGHRRSMDPFRGLQFSTRILASWMIGPHLSISDFRKPASSDGVEPFGIAPSSSNRDLTEG